MANNIHIIEYKIEFRYRIDDILLWCDQFQLNEEWEILRIKTNRKMQKTFMDRSPSVEPQKDYDIALYTKNKWICLKDNTGYVVSNLNKKPEIPNLEIKSFTATPFLTVINKEFDFHTFMTILHLKDNIKVLEFKRPSLKEGLITYNNMRIEIYDKLIVYKGEKQKEFLKFVNSLTFEDEQISNIMNMLDKDDTKTHKSIAYLTWYKAKRESQNEWPLISTERKENSIEFPKNSGIYYYYPNKYVGLAKRNDDNPQLFIPKIYKLDHLKNENSFLYKYTNDIPLENRIKIPNILKSVKNMPKLNNQKYIELSYENKIIEMDKNPEYYVYRNIILRPINEEIEIEDFNAQILDKNNERVEIYVNNKWKNDSGPRIRNIITIPWHYKQIIHDYNKLNRLKKGPIMDLTHIGVINPKGDDIITWPEIDNLYVSKTLETRRLMTFKYQKNVKIEILYDKQ
ncbi:hypothetical protein [Bartonella sp. CL26QHWL]|uniref:Killer toxin protein-like protein n=1 Tax=Komagataella phaffii TaxID=460519 RepID=A0A2R4PI92_9ASCO|nr:killer toxin protein-like protein [Komagataella phaffii]